MNSLDYFVGGDRFNWQGSSGTHLLSQNFSSNSVNGWIYYIKFGNPSIYEHYTWDSNYIYLRQDGYPSPYTFSAARWMKNGTICKGDSWSSPDNLIANFDSSCRALGSPHSFPITVQYVDRWPTYALGGTRGNVDVILIDYHYAPNTFERFFYSRQYGWVRWELWQNGVISSSATWNQSAAVTLANVAKPPKCENY